jgi:hypothetical protein
MELVCTTLCFPLTTALHDMTWHGMRLPLGYQHAMCIADAQAALATGAVEKVELRGLNTRRPTPQLEAHTRTNSPQHQAKTLKQRVACIVHSCT